MRTLVGIGVFDEDDTEIYSCNTLSKALINPGFRSIITGMYEHNTLQPKREIRVASEKLIYEKV